MKQKLSRFFLVILILGLIVRLSLDLLSLLKKGERVEEAKRVVEELKVANKKLRQRLEEVKSEAFVEKVAREELQMTREGEMIVVLPEIEMKDKRLEPEGEEDWPNWKRWLRLFF